MTALALRIVQPVHDTGYPPGPSIALQGSLTGDSAGLYLKWYSSLNSAASETQPELNADHSLAILNWSAPLAEFGSHVIVLAATDQERTDLSAIKAVTRSAMSGGAPPAASAPCIVHRLVAQIRTPAANGQVLSKAAATLEFLAPARWARKDAGPPEAWVADSDYQRINGIAMRLRLVPVGPPDPAHSADIPLTLATLPFIRADDKTWFRWAGALPANLGNGNHTLSLSVSGGGATTSAVRQVILAA